MCFFRFLRTGEVVVPSQALYDAEVHLNIDDVKLDNRDKPSYLLVQIKASKTDVFRKGSTVYLGVTGTELCPVAAIVNYMVLPRENSTTSTFFGFSDGQPLTRTRFVKELRTALAKVGINAAQFAGHSFRIGAATTATACGVPDSLIQTLGRWGECSVHPLHQDPTISAMFCVKNLSKGTVRRGHWTALYFSAACI